LVLLLPALNLLNRYLIQYVLYRTAGSGTFSDLGSPLQILYTLSPNQMVTVVTASHGSIGAVVATVLGALVAGNHWGHGSLKTSLAQGPGRLATALGQAVAVITALMLSVALNFGTAALVSKLIMIIESANAPEAVVAFPDLFVIGRGLWIGILISAAYGAAGLALGAVFRSAGAAIGATLIWFVGSRVLLNSLATSLGGPFATLNQALPNASTATLANIFGSVVGSTVDRVLEPQIDPLLAPWVLLGYVIALLATSALPIRNRDIS
jgi:hypothetical protein